MTALPMATLRPGYAISRIIRGGWQLAGGHGAVDPEQAGEDLLACCEAGILTFDCADIYTGVEDLIGAFRARYADTHGADALAKVRVHTKLVPDLELLPGLRRKDVHAIIDRSLRRLRMERLDLVQFHWWDYGVGSMLDAAGWLNEARQAGKVLHIGGTNFDTLHTLAMIDAGIPIVSMQVQYSLLDARAENALVSAAIAHDFQLLCYGTVAGGFLSDRWLGVPEPAGPLENRGLTKYRLIIEEFGGWALIQTLLAALHRIGARHGVDIATVASRVMLDRPAVAAVIVGARNRDHLAANLRIGAFTPTPQDLHEIESVLDRRQGPSGDTYTLERDRTGRHGAIIKYNLNAGEPR